MFQQREIKRRAAPGPPWSPRGLALISIFLPAGGAILTIRNLHRLHQLDDRGARRLIWVAMLIFALGFAALILLAPKDSSGRPQVDLNSQAVIAFGVAAASYVVQREPYRTWRSADALARPSAWLLAVGLAIVYEVIVLFGAVLVSLLFGGMNVAGVLVL